MLEMILLDLVLVFLIAIIIGICGFFAFMCFKFCEGIFDIAAGTVLVVIGIAVSVFLVSNITIKEEVITETVQILQTEKADDIVDTGYKTYFLTENGKKLYFIENTFSPYFNSLNGQTVDLTYKKAIHPFTFTPDMREFLTLDIIK